MSDNYDKVSLLLPMNGANDGTEFPDWSPVQKTVTAVGGAVTKTDQSQYYGSSGFFDGTNDNLQVPNSADFNFGSGLFTVETWVRPANVIGVKVICGVYNYTNNRRSWYFALSGNKLRLVVSSNGTGASAHLESTGTVSATTWAHVAVSRTATGVVFSIGGTVESEQANTTNILNVTADPLQIGAYGASNATQGEWFSGYMNDLRITKGEALYTANFTPPARLIGTISNAAVGAGKILDVAGNPAERTVIAVPRSAPVRAFSTTSGNKQVVTLTPGSSSPWTSPITGNVRVRMWGGGGRGGGRTNSLASGGAGAGAYSELESFAVVADSTYAFSVGAGATTTAAGGDTHWVDASTGLAKGGASVSDNNATGGAGGAASSGVGDIKIDGGSGSNGAGTTGGSGGNSPQGGAGGSAYVPANTPGAPGEQPGGGGAGVYRTTGIVVGGFGADGRIVLEWDGSSLVGEFEIQAPAGVDHSVVALADEADLRNDLVARVIPV